MATSSNEFYDVVPSPAGHGLTCISKITIQPGTELLAEPSFLYVPQAFTQNSSLAKEVLRMALAEADEAEKRSFLELSNAWRGTERAGVKLDPFTGTFITNSMETSPTHCGIFPKAARFQHSCTPLLTYHYQPSSKSIIVRSISLIPPGVELTVSYISALLPLSVRQENLAKNYNFSCRCTKACALAFPEGKGPRKTKGSQKSEERRDKARHFKEMMKACGTHKDGPSAKDVWDVAPAVLGEKDGALALEGLTSEFGIVWLDLAFVCASASAIAASRFAATQAHSYFSLCFGPHHERTIESRTIMKDPRKARMWNTRKLESLGEWGVKFAQDPELGNKVLMPPKKVEGLGEGKENLAVEGGEKKKRNKKKKKKNVKKADGSIEEVETEVEVEVDADGNEKEVAASS